MRLLSFRKKGLIEEKRSKKKKKVCFGSQVAICPSSVVPVEQGCVGWSGDEQRPAVSSILEPTAANGSITLRTPVTKPHAVEQRLLPDSANYSDPLRGRNAAPTDGRTEVCSLACLVKEETKSILMLMGFFASGLKGQKVTF